VTTFSADATTHFRGLAGRVLSGGAVELYVTTAEASANRMMEMVDDGTSPTTVFVTMATAPANTLYRGILLADVIDVRCGSRHFRRGVVSSTRRASMTRDEEPLRLV
jgi:hypothetical protein